MVHAVNSKEKIKEIEQIGLELTKQPIAYDICESYYYQYLRNPCERNRHTNPHFCAALSIMYFYLAILWQAAQRHKSL